MKLVIAIIKPSKLEEVRDAAVQVGGHAPHRVVGGGGDGQPVDGGVEACKATLRQLDIAERVMPVLRLDPERLLAAGPDQIAAAISWAGDRISAGPVVVAASAAPETVSRLQSQYGREASGHAIETATSIIAAELVERGVRRLVVAGGETSGAAVDRLAIPAFLIGPEIAPGVPVLRCAHDGTVLERLNS